MSLPSGKIRLTLITLFLFVSQWVTAQAPERYNAAELQLALNKLNVLGSVLYIAAHPDDENTRLIAWLANEKLLNTAYLSLTRGDGGQNLIGSHIREKLGIIRTQELLQARRIDGGHQFFTRANDFGYSKHPKETFNIWDRQKVLSDMVWVIRTFRPDVIITRFNQKPGETHGHHTASAILAEEAFKAAADKEKFPEQLQYTDVWQPEKLYWNTSSWFYEEGKFDTTGLVKVDVGAYNALLGESYTEIAARSRSMHKSQGFGASGTRGITFDYLKPLKGSTASEKVLEGLNLDWSRVKGGKEVGTLLKKASESFNPEKPEEIVPLLLQAKAALEQLPDSYWKAVKLKDLKEVLKGCMGLFLEATVPDYAYTPGDSIQLNVEAINRSRTPVTLKKIAYLFLGKDTVVNFGMGNNVPLKFTTESVLPADMAFSQPYWLRDEGTLGMYRVAEQQLIGLPENPPPLQVTFTLEINGHTLAYTVPVVHKYTDPVAGAQYRPVAVTPPVFANISDQVYVFSTAAAKPVQVVVKSGRKEISGEVSLQLPEGWRSRPASRHFDLGTKGAEAVFTFEVYPPKDQHEGVLKAVVRTGAGSYHKSLSIIHYDHFPTQVTFPDAEAKVVKVNLEKKGERIGYIMGAGDNIPASLEQIGYQVHLLNGKITPENLARYDAVILGIRAYNTVDRLKYQQDELMEYVRNGGTMIVQYNTSFRLVTENFSPYPLRLSRDRVTVEEAPVRILKPDHPVMNFPNKITPADFEHWVQERGLYFPDEWDDRFVAILSSHDPGEKPRNGGLLVTRYGKGYYIYTGYSWFRELPAGVPGAYRIFTNLISIGKDKANP